mgnify:CR=1 FL=1
MAKRRIKRINKRRINRRIIVRKSTHLPDGGPSDLLSANANLLQRFDLQNVRPGTAARA